MRLPIAVTIVLATVVASCAHVSADKLQTPLVPTVQPAEVIPGPAASRVPAPSPAPVANPAPAAPVVSPPKPQLDFKALEQRLRDTSAIGLFTKLSLKNQVDDLLNSFRGYHAGRLPPTLDELHERYDGILLKVVTLLQGDDAGLASAIAASRGAIWERLSNRESFQAI